MYTTLALHHCNRGIGRFNTLLSQVCCPANFLRFYRRGVQSYNEMGRRMELKPYAAMESISSLVVWLASQRPRPEAAQSLRREDDVRQEGGARAGFAAARHPRLDRGADPCASVLGGDDAGRQVAGFGPGGARGAACTLVLWCRPRWASLVA